MKSELGYLFRHPHNTGITKLFLGWKGPVKTGREMEETVADVLTALGAITLPRAGTRRINGKTHSSADFSRLFKAMGQSV